MQGDQAEYSQERHKREVKTSMSRYTIDQVEDSPDLYANTIQQPFFKANQERKIMMMDTALKANQLFLNELLQYIHFIDQDHQYQPFEVTKPNNKSKLRSTIRQFYREWCSESPELKDYLRLVDECKKYLKPSSFILVPGCGLGRLVFELVRAGFAAEGNQVTFYMLFGSNFIINTSEQTQQFTIYPFVHARDYYLNQQDAYRPVRVPDVVPSNQLGDDPKFGICAGDFVQVYQRRPQQFDGIVTCFFLDTGNNIFHYIDTITKTLKEDGIWINYGPLLYHYKDMPGQVSIEVSWDIIKTYISKSFSLLQESTIATTYCHDPKRELSVIYDCIYFVAKKTIDQNDSS